MAAVAWLIAEADHRRHASLDARPSSGFRPGTCVLTLCGHQYCTETRPTSEATHCPVCDRRARQVDNTHRT